MIDKHAVQSLLQPLTDKPPDKTGETGTSRSILGSDRGRSGRFLPGNRANPKGRPRRVLSQATLFARTLLEEAAPALAQKAIDEAKAGNPIAMKLCLERLIPIPQDREIRLNLPTHLSTPDDILAFHNALLSAVASGDVTPQQAQAVSAVLEARRRSWEAVELSRHHSALDRNLEMPGRGNPDEL